MASTAYNTNQLFPLWQLTPRRPAVVAASQFQSEPADAGTAPALPASAVSSNTSEIEQLSPMTESTELDDQHSVAPTSGMPRASEAPDNITEPTEMGEVLHHLLSLHRFDTAFLNAFSATCATTPSSSGSTGTASVKTHGAVPLAPAIPAALRDPILSRFWISSTSSGRPCEMDSSCTS